MRYFNIEVINKRDQLKKTTSMKNCQFESLRELILKLAEECHESEDDDFYSLKIEQLTNKEE